MQDLMKHNYYKKLLQLHAEGKVPTACLSAVDIYHDDWCRIYQGGYCNCDPEIETYRLDLLDPERN